MAIGNRFPAETNNIVTKTTTYTALPEDDVILGNTSGGAFSITLPAAAAVKGKVMTFKYIDSGYANALTIDGNGSETIDGSTTTTLNTQDEVLTIVSDGSNWEILERKTITPVTAFTPTGAWSTNTTYTGFWRRSGDMCIFDIAVATAGAPDAASLTITIPHTIDTAKLSNTAWNSLHGSNALAHDNDANLRHVCAVDYASTTTVAICSTGDNAGSINFGNAVSNTAPFTWAASDTLVVHFEVPISGWNP